MLDYPLRRRMLIQLDVSHHVPVLDLLYFISLLNCYCYLFSLYSLAAEGFTRGRSYNIRIDDQVLLRFSPKNSDSTYYFGDMVLKFVLLHFLLFYFQNWLSQFFHCRLVGHLPFFTELESGGALR